MEQFYCLYDETLFANAGGEARKLAGGGLAVVMTCGEEATMIIAMIPGREPVIVDASYEFPNDVRLMERAFKDWPEEVLAEIQVMVQRYQPAWWK
ncbi:hypothetical protein SDD30_01615 [Moorella naiadis]|uniref:hypothetical protein n=1 Tax=Moorella naiadis (nom. illeg.) TaxID=3093670 RepID=UPI003D9CB109